MIEETIRQIEARLDAEANLAPEMRAELRALLAKLRAEAAGLPPLRTAPTDSRNETGEARSLQDDVNQLTRSVEEFEESHPKLVQLANHLATTLAGLGI